MAAYVECPVCSAIPDEESGFYTGPENVAKYPDVMAISRIPGELGLEQMTEKQHNLWVCKSCGTYYYADTLERGYPTGSIQTRLFRITASQAEYYRSRFCSTCRQLHINYREARQEAEKWLGHHNASMRAFGARTLADGYRMEADIESLKALLKHPDASVRLGAVSAFRRGPWFMIDKEPKPVMPQLADCLSDPDASVRSEAARVLNYAMDGRFWGGMAIDRLRKIPPAQRTREVWEVLLAEPQCMDDLRQGMLSTDGEVRRNALHRAYYWSGFHTGDIAGFRELLDKTPESERTPEIKEYLLDRNPGHHWEDDDD